MANNNFSTIAFNGEQVTTENARNMDGSCLITDPNSDTKNLVAKSRIQHVTECL